MKWFGQCRKRETLLKRCFSRVKIEKDIDENSKDRSNELQPPQDFDDDDDDELST